MLVNDLRYALQVFGRNPGVAALAVLTLGLGIGASTAMFSVVSNVLLQPFPYKDASRLMVITERDEKHNRVQPYSLSYLNFQDFSAAQRSFEELALFRAPATYRVNGRDRSAVSVRMVSSNFLTFLGVTPIIGRGFSADDDEGSASSVVLSYGGWQRLFGAQRMGQVTVTTSTSVLGEKLDFNSRTYNVIGILPREFSFYTADSNQNADAYIVIGPESAKWTARVRRPGIEAIGRLRPGVTKAAAFAELNNIAHQLRALYPDDNQNRGAAVDSLSDSVIDEDLRKTLSLLGVAVALVLLIACANVTNLLLARAAARQKEIAIRFALGGRWQVIRQLLAESMVLGLAGGMVGTVIAIVAIDLLVISAPFGLPRISSIGMHWPVLLFSFAISVATGLAFGIPPVIQALRASMLNELKDGGTSSTSTRNIPQKLIVVGEFVLATGLLIGAGLVYRSTQNALSGNPGFDTRNIWSLSVLVSPEDFPSASERRRLMKDLVARFSAMPDVRATSAVIGGLPKPIAVDPAYLRLMGIRLLKGRFFDETDSATSLPTIVIDEGLARARFGSEDPLGKPFVIDLPGVRELQLDRPREVIGVVSHIKRLGIETTDDIVIQSQFYLASDQLPDDLMATVSPRILLKAPWRDEGKMPDGELARMLLEKMTGFVRGINSRLDASAPVKMQDAVERALLPRRYVARIFGIFGLLAFVLAGMGVLGLMSYSVSQRTQEIGIRMALGAESRHVVRMVVLQAASLTATGVAVGVAASFWLKRFVEGYLYDVSTTDPLTYAAAIVLLLVVSLAAAWLPAWRASRLEPMLALRGSRNVLTGLETNRGRQAAAASTSLEPCIEVSNLGKTYKTFRGKPAPALTGVSFDIEPGTIFGLIGANGAGKTTLVKILMGLATPTTGSARLLGCGPGDPIAKKRIGYLPESMKIPDHFGPVNFLRYMGTLNDVDKATLEARIPMLLEKVGLGGVSKPVKSFSKGMQQRLGLAQALLNDPELLFLDEPTDGLDPLGRIFVRDLLVQLRNEGKTVFLNSHLLSEIELVCDRIVILDKGAVACTTKPSEFTSGAGEYIIRIDAAEPSVAEKARRAAASVIASASWHDSIVRFRPSSTEHLNELLDALRRARVPIVSVEPVKLSLEQFFIQVVSDKES